MNTKPFLLALLTAMLALGSCNTIVENTPTPKFITVSTNIATKVTTSDDGTQSFVKDDKISVYAWVGEATTVPEQSARVVNNSINTFDGTKWTADPQMLWKNLTAQHYFIGVYPCNTAAEADLTKVACTVDPTKQTESDVLVATEFTGKIAESNPVNLTFDHVMSKVIIKLSYRNQWGEGVVPNVTSVVLENVSSNGTINYLTKSVTADNSRAEMIVPEVKKNTEFASVIIPQDGIRKVVVNIGGKLFVYQHSEDFKFDQSNYTTINLIVGRNQIDLGEVTINNWKEGPSVVGGEAYD